MIATQSKLEKAQAMHRRRVMLAVIAYNLAGNPPGWIRRGVERTARICRALESRPQ